MVADPRSNSIIVRSENSSRVARVRQLIEQLDTPGRAGGNIFIIYLKNAEAARVAQTLRSLLTGGADVAPQGAGSLAPAAAAAPSGALAGVAAAAAQPSGTGGGAGAVAFAAERRVDPGGPDEQRADHPGAGTRLQQPAGDHREARHPPRAGLRRGADRRGGRRQGGAVRHPVAGADRDRHGTACRASAAPTSARAAAAATSSTRRSTSATLGPGLNLGIMNGTVTIPGLGQILNLAFLAAGARDRRQRQHPVDADAAHAGQRGSEDRRRAERAVHHRPVRDDRERRPA